MAKYLVSIKAIEYQVEVNGNEIILIGSRPLELKYGSKSNPKTIVQIEGMTFEVRLENQTNLPMPILVLTHRDVTSPMPGIIIKTSVTDGEYVVQGKTLFTMESMKMQMELRAPISGYIEMVIPSNQSKIEKGSLLLKIRHAP